MKQFYINDIFNIIIYEIYMGHQYNPITVSHKFKV